MTEPVGYIGTSDNNCCLGCGCLITSGMVSVVVIAIAVAFIVGMFRG